MRVTKQQAAGLQIDAAIKAYEEGNLPAAITLAAAAEGAMPRHDHALYRYMRAAFAMYFDKGRGVDGYLNAARDWLKHYNNNQPTEMDLGNEPELYIIRACSRYQNVYGREAETETMQAFFAEARRDID